MTMTTTPAERRIDYLECALKDLRKLEHKLNRAIREDTPVDLNDDVLIALDGITPHVDLALEISRRGW